MLKSTKNYIIFFFLALLASSSYANSDSRPIIQEKAGNLRGSSDFNKQVDAEIKKVETANSELNKNLDSSDNNSEVKNSKEKELKRENINSDNKNLYKKLKKRKKWKKKKTEDL